MYFIRRSVGTAEYECAFEITGLHNGQRAGRYIIAIIQYSDNYLT